MERLRHQSPYRRHQQFVTSHIDDDDADDDDDAADAILDRVDDQLSRVRPKQQIPSVSPARRRAAAAGADESLPPSRGSRNGDDVTTATSQRRATSVGSNNKRSAGLIDHGGNDTGLGSISADGNCSDDDESDNTPREGPSLTHHYTDDVTAVLEEQDMDSCRRKLALIDGEMERQIEARFRETMASITGETQRKRHQRKDNFDIESVRTDDIENEFRKTLVDLEIIAQPVAKKDLAPSQPVAAVTLRQRHDSSIASNDNDIDDVDGASVKTEDFETHFHQTTTKTVKQVANTPVMNFDPFIVDSDVETVTSQAVRDTFQTVLGRSDQANVLPPARNVGSGTGFQRRVPTARRKREASPLSDFDPDFDDQKVNDSSRTLLADVEKWKKALQSVEPQQCSAIERRPAKFPAVIRQPVTTMTVSTKLASARLALENKTDFEVSCRLKQELAKLQTQLKQAMQTKQAVKQTTDRLQALAAQHQLDIMAAEKQLKESRSAAESARSELMMAEFKRDSARKELESLTADVDNRRLQLQRLAVHEKTAADEQLVAESRTSQDLNDERRQWEQMLSELQQRNEQLVAEKNEQKQHLEEDFQKALQTKDQQSAEINREKEKLQAKVAELEAKCQQIEYERNEFMQKKNTEFQTMRSEIQEQMSQSRDRLTREVAELRNSVDELTDQLGLSRQENRRKDELNAQLREQLDRQASELEQQNLLHSSLLEENIRSLRGIIKEKELAVNAVKEQAEQEKQAAIEESCQHLQADHQRALQEQEEQLTAQLTTLQGQLSAKEVELQVLRDRIHEQEEWMNQMTERMQQENYEKMQEALENERSRLEAENEHQLNAQLDSMKEEMVRSGRQLREELQRERDVVLLCRQQIEALEQELDRMQQSIHDAYRDTLQKVDSRYSSPQQSPSAEKLHYQEMLQSTTEKLNEVIRKQKEELDRLRQENVELNIQWQERMSAIDQVDRKLSEELNGQSEKLAKVLQQVNDSAAAAAGLSSSWSPAKTSGAGGTTTGRTSETRSSLNTAATNLINCCEKLLDRLVEQQKQIDEHNRVIAKLNRSTKEEIETLKSRMQDEKYQALEALKNRLIQEHLQEVDKLHASLSKGDDGLHTALREKDRELREIQQNMKAWKDQTLQKLAHKFKDEMNKELARRQAKQLLAETEKENSLRQVDAKLSSVHRPMARHSSLIRRTQNFTGSPVGGQQMLDSSRLSILSQKMGASVPDLSVLSSPVVAQKAKSASVPSDPSGFALQLRQLQLQAQRAEANWKHADERARNNEHLLNQKMIELAELQSVVTQQAKELAHIQRAYSKLQSKYASATATSRTSSALVGSSGSKHEQPANHRR
jgi:hypothetical protein